jgi:predicted transcriptional regulator of viral defense system
MLHELSDVLPARAHLTLPAKWRKRRLRVPEGVVLHYADLPKRDREWVGALPVTSPARTLSDSAADHVSLEVLSSAVSQALARGMVSRRQATAVERATGLDA